MQPSFVTRLPVSFSYRLACRQRLINIPEDVARIRGLLRLAHGRRGERHAVFNLLLTEGRPNGQGLGMTVEEAEASHAVDGEPVRCKGSRVPHRPGAAGVV